jgi:hypothetical protein
MLNDDIYFHGKNFLRYTDIKKNKPIYFSYLLHNWAHQKEATVLFCVNIVLCCFYRQRIFFASGFQSKEPTWVLKMSIMKIIELFVA